MMKCTGKRVARLVAAVGARWAVAIAMALTPQLVCAQTVQLVPTTYEAGHFYATPQTTGNHVLKLLVDTGGGGGSGMYWITADAAKRLGLAASTCKLGKHAIKVARIPTFMAGHGLPPPMNSPCGNALMVQPGPYHAGDGQLGAGYLPGRIWTFDYLSHQLSVQPPQWQPAPSAHATSLGLSSGFARITIFVAGEPIQMLLDTGATAHPTPAGEKASHTPVVDGYGVTSYIGPKVFNHWRRAHPDWQMVRAGDDLHGSGHATAIIRVPKVVVAGWSVGPVWFTEQSGVAAYISRFTDKPISGALGANVFHHFVMTIDYPRKTAFFECTGGCEPAAFGNKKREAGRCRPASRPGGPAEKCRHPLDSGVGPA